MRQTLLFMMLVLAAATAAPARGSSYDDFAHGLSATQRDDNQAAVDDFTAALTAGDLSPGVVPLAYRGRGLVYVRLGRCRLALADLDAALKLRPDDLDATVYRAEAHLCAGDPAAALADYTAILATHRNAEVYGMRGRVRLRTGDAAGAVEDFTRQSQIVPKNAYAALWLDIARQHAGTFDAKAAAQEARRFDSHPWPGIVVQFYTGDGSVDEVDRAAARPDTKAPEYQLCEADFYVGEFLLGTQDMAGARERLRRAADRCPKFFVERSFALFEMERLK